MPRFIHTADWQVGRQFSRFDADDAQRLAAARIETVARIGELATQLDADAVLVAGDTFDLQNVGEKTLRRLFNSLEHYSGHWLIVPGNHDAALPISVWTRSQELGLLTDNIHIFTETGLFEQPEAGFAVLGAALTQRRSLSDITEPFDQIVSAPGLVRIGLAHGSVTKHLPEQADGGNPINVDRVRSAQLDYLALGDWHGQLTVDPRCAYSGTPEPDGFRDNEPGYVLEVAIEKAGAEPVIIKHAIAAHHWHVVSAELAVPSDLDALGASLEKFGSTDVLRIDLSGQVDLACEQQLDGLLAKTAARIACLRVRRESLRLVPGSEELADLPVPGYLTDVLDSLRVQAADDNDEDQAVAAEALSLLAASLREHAGPEG